MAIFFIIITFFSMTFGQILPYEFADYKLQHKFYDTIWLGLPVAILLTLFGTIKLKSTKTKNGSIVVITVIGSIISYLIMGSLLMLDIGFGSWATIRTLYIHKTKDKMIKEQHFDIGIFGYAGQRTVEIKPFLKYWILPSDVNVYTIDKNEWEFVNKEGNR